MTDGRARRGGRDAPAGFSPHLGWQLRLCTCGARRAAAHALPRTPPVTSSPPSRPPTAPAQEGHPGAPVLIRAYRKDGQETA